MRTLKKEKNVLDINNLIAKVVLPLKEAAIERAEENMRKLISDTFIKLMNDGMDVEKYAPYPRYVHGFEYHWAKEKYNFVRRITTPLNSHRRMGEPDICKANDKGVEREIIKAKRQAAEQYDKFVLKLTLKIGEVTDAELSGDHVWSHSFLTVYLPNGDKQIWKTQSIWNISKYQKIFTQYPSRKIKDRDDVRHA